MPQLDPDLVSANAQHSVAAVRQRLGRLQRVLELVHDACRSVLDPDRDFGAQVKVDVDATLRWETVPDLLAIIIEIALRWANRWAAEGGACLHLPRLLVRAAASDLQLRLDLFAATDPPEALAAVGLAEAENAQTDQCVPQRPEAADLALAQHFARQLNGQIHVVPDPPEGWNTHLRICLEPINLPRERGVAENDS